MDFYSSSQLDATPIDAIEPFMEELSEIVKEMQQKLPTETRILEGSDMIEREDIRIPPPKDPQAILDQLTGKNELSQGETKEDQWSNASANGCWTTAPIPDSTPELSSSASIAELFDQNCPIQFFTVRPSPASTRFSGERLESCGCGTDTTNGRCACMEQTINVPMAGTPSEEK